MTHTQISKLTDASIDHNYPQITNPEITDPYITDNNNEKKQEKISIHFQVGGGVLLATNLIKLVAYATPCKGDDKVADVIAPILDLAYFIIVIWGSVKVFGRF